MKEGKGVRKGYLGRQRRPKTVRTDIDYSKETGRLGRTQPSASTGGQQETLAALGRDYCIDFTGRKSEDGDSTQPPVGPVVGSGDEEEHKGR